MTFDSKTATTLFYDEGDHVLANTADATKKVDRLAPIIYRLSETDAGGFKFNKTDTAYIMPGTLFGKGIKNNSDLVINAYVNSTKPTGSIFCGAKGMGKTQQIEYICNQALKLGIPVITIDQPIRKPIVEAAIRAVGKCVIYIDEFGKVYNGGDGESACLKDELLTLFSNSSLGQILFLISENNLFSLSQYIINRPSRFLFRFMYEKLSNDTATEICEFFKLDASKAKFIVEYIEDTKSSMDTCICLARNAVTCADVYAVKELFEVMNIPKPSQYAWTIYTPTGDAGKITFKANRKSLEVTDASGSVHVLNFDSIYKECLYNTTYRCYVLVGMAGSSENVELGVKSGGRIKDDDPNPVQYHQLVKH